MILRYYFLIVTYVGEMGLVTSNTAYPLAPDVHQGNPSLIQPLGIEGWRRLKRTPPHSPPSDTSANTHAVSPETPSEPSWRHLKSTLNSATSHGLYVFWHSATFPFKIALVIYAPCIPKPDPACPGGRQSVRPTVQISPLPRIKGQIPAH